MNYLEKYDCWQRNEYGYEEEAEGGRDDGASEMGSRAVRSRIQFLL